MTRLLQSLNPAHSLRARLGLASGLVALTLSVLLSVAIGEMAERYLAQDVGHSFSDLAYQMADKLDRQMFERTKDIEVLSSLPLIRDRATDPADTRALLDRLQEAYPSYAWVGLLDERGRVVAATDGLLEGVDLSAREHFQRGSQATWVGDVHDAIALARLLPNPDNQPVRFLDVAVPVTGLDGQPRGVLLAHPSWTWVREVQASLVQSVGPGRQVEMAIVGADGTVLLAPDGSYGPGPDGAYPKLDLVQLGVVDGVAAGYASPAWPDGERYVTGFAHSPGHLSYKGLGWTVLIRQPVDEALATAGELQAWILTAGTLLGLIFASVGWVLAGEITRRLRALADATDRYRRGAREIALQPARGSDEVAALSESLRTMIATLSQHEDDLRTLNEALEQRVRERTRELQTLAHIARVTDNAVVITDAQGCIEWVNAGFTQMSEYGLDEVVGKTLHFLHGPDTLPPGLMEADRQFRAGRPYVFEIKHYTKSGKPFWAEIEVHPIFDDHGKLVRQVAMHRDATAGRNREERLRQIALHDTLTGLANHGLFMDRVQHASRRASRDTTQLFAVLFIDLDSLKAVNDTCGHAAGDQLLIAVAHRLELSVRESDTVARVGGDEFALLLEQVLSVAEARTVAGRIITSLSQPYEIEGRRLEVSASVGVALNDGPTVEAEEVIREADEAMYMAKRAGKNRFVVSPRNLDSSHDEEMALRYRLEQGAITSFPGVASQPGSREWPGASPLPPG